MVSLHIVIFQFKYSKNEPINQNGFFYVLCDTTVFSETDSVRNTILINKTNELINNHIS